MSNLKCKYYKTIQSRKILYCKIIIKSFLDANLEEAQKIIELAGTFNGVIINWRILEFIIEIIYRVSLFKWVIKSVDY